jgi:hypothetical protein
VTPRFSSRIGVFCGLLLTLVWIAGCSNNDNSTTTGGVGATGSYTGTFSAGSGATGKVSFSIPASLAAASAVTATLASAPVSITGSVATPTGTFALTGTFDSSTGELSLQGGAYQFTGTLQADGTFQGTCVTPAGAGVFVTLHGDGTTVTVFCGTYARCDDALCTSTTLLGSFNAAVSGSVAIFAISSPGGSVIVAGTVSVSGGHTFVELDFAYGSSTVHAGGEIVGSSLIGDWAVTPAGTGDTGIWSGSTSECQASR